jgi:hypothetical protein
LRSDGQSTIALDGDRAIGERKLDQMSRRSSGPRRSESVESYLRQTRAGAALALLALAAAIASEQFAERLWGRHPLLAGLASSAIVVMLSVAVVNEALEIRRRRRWSDDVLGANGRGPLSPARGPRVSTIRAGRRGRRLLAWRWRWRDSCLSIRPSMIDPR